MKLSVSTELELDGATNSGYVTWLDVKVSDGGATFGTARIALVHVGEIAEPNTIIAHRVPGMLNKNDHGTGISMGFFCDAFASFSWPGAFCIPFLLMFALLCVYSLFLSFRLWQNIYGLCLVLAMPHSFSESGIASQIPLVLQTPLVFVVVMYFILFLVSYAMRAQVRIQQIRRGPRQGNRARLVSRTLALGGRADAE